MAKVTIKSNTLKSIIFECVTKILKEGFSGNLIYKVTGKAQVFIRGEQTYHDMYGMEPDEYKEIEVWVPCVLYVSAKSEEEAKHLASIYNYDEYVDGQPGDEIKVESIQVEGDADGEETGVLDYSFDETPEYDGPYDEYDRYGDLDESISKALKSLLREYQNDNPYFQQVDHKEGFRAASLIGKKVAFKTRHMSTGFVVDDVQAQRDGWLLRAKREDGRQIKVRDIDALINGRNPAPSAELYYGGEKNCEGFAVLA